MIYQKVYNKTTVDDFTTMFFLLLFFAIKNAWQMFIINNSSQFKTNTNDKSVLKKDRLLFRKRKMMAR